jgi:hypothetical protein
MDCAYYKYPILASNYKKHQIHTLQKNSVDRLISRLLKTGCRLYNTVLNEQEGSGGVMLQVSTIPA